MVSSTYNNFQNKNTVLFIRKFHNTIIFTNKNLGNNNRLINKATKIENMWKKITNIFEVAWRNKFNDKAYVNRRRIHRRNESSSNQ